MYARTVTFVVSYILDSNIRTKNSLAQGWFAIQLECIAQELIQEWVGRLWFMALIAWQTNANAAPPSAQNTHSQSGAREDTVYLCICCTLVLCLAISRNANRTPDLSPAILGVSPQRHESPLLDWEIVSLLKVQRNCPIRLHPRLHTQKMEAKAWKAILWLRSKLGKWTRAWKTHYFMRMRKQQELSQTHYFHFCSIWEYFKTDRSSELVRQ